MTLRIIKKKKMMKIVNQFFVYLLAIAIIGCSTNPIPVSQPKEYAYLASFVKKDTLWNSDDWFIFISHLNEKHLSELALDWGVLKETSPGIDVTWDKNNSKQKLISVGNPKKAIDSLGGRQQAISLLQKEINCAYKLICVFNDKDINWHEIVIWAAEKNGLNKSQYTKSSFEAERALINRFFEKNWDQLTPKQRKEVLEKSEITGLSVNDKNVMIAASGTAALATLNAGVALSGFTFYTTMSSVIASTASVVGVTFPFAVYTGASTTVATLSGPYGWTLLAASAAGLSLYKSWPDEAKVTRMIISLHVIKAKALEDSVK